ncbi:MAG: hypothetical protein A2Y17_12155 [Clostridiales bacterium GWF2_38_85]|nr:MAG: hypothetical protein A2Y17_12155 [Clostridiales bacterium GWF2_38_85]
MNIEEQLKEHILSQYKSIREFCMRNNFPYSTVDSIFKRGILGSSVSIIIKICDRLSIDVDELISGKIVEKSSVLNPEITEHEKRVISAYRNNPSMQGAIDKLLNIENGSNCEIASDMCGVLKQADNIRLPTKSK